MGVGKAWCKQGWSLILGRPHDHLPTHLLAVVSFLWQGWLQVEQVPSFARIPFAVEHSPHTTTEMKPRASEDSTHSSSVLVEISPLEILDGMSSIFSRVDLNSIKVQCWRTRDTDTES